MRVRWRRKCGDRSWMLCTSIEVPIAWGLTEYFVVVGLCSGKIAEVWYPLEDGATAALVFTSLDLQSDTGGFGKGLVDAPVLHGGAF
jgi:hypothetical protein